MSLAKLLADPQMTVHEIGAWLDAMNHPQRMAALSETTKKQQARLWDLAEDSEPITLHHFVPPDVKPRTEVTHHGRNTLPTLNFFRKPMARPEDGSPRLFGYNDASTQRLVGPGYFVAHDTVGNPAWEERGAWVVDYYQVPDGAVPDHWPKVVPNWRGLQVLIYFHTRDFMRKVSDHVSIGMAFKVESSLNNWFTLCREDKA